MYLVLSLIQLMIVQSVHHHHSIECTCTFDTMMMMSTLYNHQLYQGKNKVHSILWLWCTLCTIISYIRERTRYIRYYDCDVHFVHSSAISGKEQGTFDTMIVMYSGHHNHSIECTLFFPWYSWWLYKVDITIIVSNVPCSFPDIADECTRKNKVHSILWLWCPLCTFISCIRERTRYIRYYDCDVPCCFPDIADDCTKCTSQS
jgi:glycosyltransferase involved in cell wall biosynthesis